MCLTYVFRCRDLASSSSNCSTFIQYLLIELSIGKAPLIDVLLSKFKKLCSLDRPTRTQIRSTSNPRREKRFDDVSSGAARKIVV